MVAKNPSRLLSSFALLAKLVAVVALVFVFLSTVSTADDGVQQEALARSQQRACRVCKSAPLPVVSPALVIAGSYRFEAINRRLQKVHEPELLAPLAGSLRPWLGRSPPLSDRFSS